MLSCGESGPLSTALGASILVVAALLSVGALIGWARRAGHPDRGPLVLAGAALGVTTGALNLVFGTTGVWRSCSYALPFPVVFTYYVLLPMIFGTLLARGYRWAAGRVPRAALLYGALTVVVIAPLIAIGDGAAIQSGILAMTGGYAIWMDVVLGVALLWLPVAISGWLGSRRSAAEERTRR